MNPLTGHREERVLIEGNNGSENKILLKNDELQSCIQAYYSKYKGVGSRKLYNSITKVFIGITEREIQKYINSLHINQRLHPRFINKKKLKPVISHGVMDLVDMQNTCGKQW